MLLGAGPGGVGRSRLCRSLCGSERAPPRRGLEWDSGGGLGWLGGRGWMEVV